MNEILTVNWNLFEAINQPASSHSLLGQLMIFGANDVIFLAPLLLLMLWLSLLSRAQGVPTGKGTGGSFVAQARAQGQRFALLGCLAVVLGILLTLTIGNLLFEPRPFVSHPGIVHQLVPHPADAAFPSDHETVIAAVATILVLYLMTVILPLRRMASANSPEFAVLSRLAAVVTILAVLGLLAVAYIGVSRVYVGVHYPGDILGGAASGAIAGGAAAAVRPIAEPALGPLIRLARRVRLA
ncbi:MAG TPA: phosphatase PAP2 family protein [Ktedonobacterales bacterium]|nr:phosphatase PAP2 family protein [Ktedonobacterales bacterium]